MSKSSKQKGKKNKNKQRSGQQQQPKLHVDTVDTEQLAAKLLEAAAAEATADAEPKLEAEVALETAAEAESLLVTKRTTVENLRAALIAKQKEQPKGWKQQVKAGKMVNAHVPKRFNRGG